MRKKRSRTIIQHLTGLIDERVPLAAVKARVARKLMNNGHSKESFRVLLEIDPTLHEARAFFSTACAMHRGDA